MTISLAATRSGARVRHAESPGSRPMFDRRFPGGMFFFLVLATAGHAADANKSAFRSFLNMHCVSCHDADTKQGGLNLSALPDRFDDPAVAARWVRVHDRIAAGEMPPAKKPRPPKAETDTALKGLSDALVAAEAVRRAKEGRAPVRRLNRDEFEHTLRDLLDL